MNSSIFDNTPAGQFIDVTVSLNGKVGTKELKVCMVKTRSITFIEVDRENRQNIFRKVDRKDIVEFRPFAICEITVRDGILPVKWESSWDSIGSPSQMVQSYGRFAQAAKPFNSTTNSAVGFPMV
mgnify:CR=1 FL=1